MTYQENTPELDEVAADASKAPQVLMDAAQGRLPDSIREPGLTLTKEQIKNIKRYEMAGLALPIEIGAVISYLGYKPGDGAGTGLEPADFQKTFTLIKTHAGTWNPLRSALTDVSSQLVLFSGRIKNNGITMEEIYGDIKALNKLDGYDIETLEDVRNLKDELGDRLNELKLGEKDKNRVSKFSQFLANILEDIEAQQNEAQALKNRLNMFAAELADKVRPAIQLKIRTILNSDLKAETTKLEEEIEERAREITELNAAYKKTVMSALDAASKLNIIGLATAIYNGVEAENIRKTRNDLRKLQAEKIDEVATKKKVYGSLCRVRSDLEDLDIIVIDADIATKNLVTVWSTITNYINGSRTAVDDIDDALDLYTFMFNFRSVISPWEDVARDARLLHQVFDEADKEFRLEYAPEKNMNRRGYMSMNNAIAFDEFDIKAMREAQSASNSKMIDVEMYHTSTNYLQNIFAKCSRLNDALNKAQSELVGAASTISFGLTSSIDALATLQKDLADDPSEKQRNAILTLITQKINRGVTTAGEGARKLTDYFKSTNEPFNRESTLRSLKDLEKEASELPTELTKLEERKSAINDELLTLGEAIKALETNGLAAIGEETILNAENLAALQLGGPHMAAVKAALDLLQKSLADLEASLNYHGLLSLRRNLRDRLEAVTQQVNDKKTQARTVDQRTKLIDSVHDFDDQRMLYLQEYSKILTSLNSFLDQHNVMSTDEEAVGQWVQDVNLLIQYLAPLR